MRRSAFVSMVITRKGGKVVTTPRAEGPLFLARDGRRLDRPGAAQVVRRVTRRAGIAKQVSPHTLRHAFITAALDAGVPLRFAGGGLARCPAHHDAV